MARAGKLFHGPETTESELERWPVM